MNGALLVDKPAGITSHDAIAIVRRALKEGGAPRPAVGHTGTLDPFATGLLVVLVGKATRLARFLDGFEKEYLATVRLGQGSDTDDATGVLTPSTPDFGLRTSDLEAALTAFVGTQQQLPPAFSAKKIDGTRAYARARKGEAVVLKPAEITIHALDLLDYRWPEVRLRAVVSTGTYLRSLARDLGAKLGTEAHCSELRRERIGGFSVKNAETLEALQAGQAVGRAGGPKLLPMTEVVAHLAKQELGEGEFAFIRNGRPVPAAVEGGPVALTFRGELAAIAEVGEGMARPVVVLAE